MQGGAGGQGLQGIDDFLFGPLPSAEGADQDSVRAMDGDSEAADGHSCGGIIGQKQAGTMLDCQIRLVSGNWSFRLVR